ncbi:MAG: HU family DNA-binding protein [Bacteroidales bacterium]|nr:HU family DNA-binding protein [Bacteroidales bacterium]
MPVKFNVVAKKNPIKKDLPPKHYATAISNGELTLKQLAKRVSESSSFSEGDLMGILVTILKIIPDALADGKIVRLGDLGSFRVSISSNGSESERKVSANNIRLAKVTFTPGRDLKDAINNFRFEKA